MSSTETPGTANRGRSSETELRRFGLIVGSVFGAMGLWPLVVRGMGPRWWAVALGVGLIGPALAMPRVLAPAHHLWMGLAEVLAWINTRLLLGVVFFGIVTPMGVVMRLLGKDPMRRKSDPSAVTYRVGRWPRPATHMMRQF